MPNKPSGKRSQHGRLFLQGRELSHLPEARRRIVRNILEMEQRKGRELDDMIATFVRNYRAHQELLRKGASVHRPSREAIEQAFDREQDRLDNMRKHLDNLAKRRKKFEMEH